MNINELINKPIENMTEEELKKLENIGKREYDRVYRERNREKRQESLRLSRIRKGLKTLKENNGTLDDSSTLEQKTVVTEKEKRSTSVSESDYSWKRYRVNPNQASAFKKCADQIGITQTAALEEAMRDWIAKNTD